MKILYGFSAGRWTDYRDYVAEIASIEAAISHAGVADRVTLEVVELCARAELRRAMLRRRYQIVVIAGHGPDFGLFETEGPRRRRSCAKAFAREMGLYAAANACVLLIGCNSSWLSPGLALRGLRGVSFDRALPAGALREFVSAFFDGVCAGYPFEFAYELGRGSMAYEYGEYLAYARWFGPRADAREGGHGR